MPGRVLCFFSNFFTGQQKIKVYITASTLIINLKRISNESMDYYFGCTTVYIGSNQCRFSNKNEEK